MRLGDLDKAEAVLRNIADHLKESGSEDLLWASAYTAADVIKRQRTIDAVPVVLCKDCNEGELVGKTPSGCEHIFCHIHKEWVAPDYFCGSGEQKDGDG